MRPNILIVGGGSGGTILANSLSPRRFEVTVLSRERRHLFQPGLLYVAFRHARTDIERAERALLRRGVRLIEETVTAVDFAGRTVTTAGGATYGYDELVLAPGIHPDLSQVPGLAEVNREFGDYHSGIDQAQKLWHRLDSFNGGTVVVGQTTPICKCPPSPIEGALLAEQLIRERGLREKTRIIFITPYPRAYPAEPMNQIVEPILKDRGIEIMTFFDVDHIDLEKRTIESIEGESVPFDLPLLIPPFTGPAIEYRPAVLDADGFIITDPQSLRVRGVEHVYAIGDATNLPTSKSGVGAHLEAKVVARALAGKPAAFTGRTHCPFDVGYGKGTFVVSTYSAPAVRSKPTRLKHAMKMAFARLYWLSLRGWIEPVLRTYFAVTNPEGRLPGAGQI